MPENQLSPRTGIIISMFPELHETFILRELVALERRGLDFDIYSLQYPRDPITLDDAIRLSTERTHYSGLITFATLGALLRTLVSRPRRVLRACLAVIVQGRDRPKDVLKNLAILPITLHFARTGKQRGITHWHGHWANIPTTACWYIKQIYGDSWSAAIHGEDIFSPNRFLRYKLDDAAFSVVCSGYFCNHLQQQLGLANPRQIHLNYHGLDPRVMERTTPVARDKRVPGDTLNLVSIGRLVPTKGHDVIIRACAKLKANKGVNFHLNLIGSGPEDGALKALAIEQGVAGNITFTGALSFEEVLSTLEAADVFVLAPRLIPGHPPDGIPNVIAEAMALRVPVVSTRVSAIPELVEHGVTGMLVEVDDAQGFYASLVELGDNPALLQAISEQAYTRVARLFDQQKNINELIGLFEQYVPGRVVQAGHG